MRLVTNASTPRDRSRSSSAAGFTLLGISVFLLLISVVAALVLPSIQQAVRNGRARATSADLRQFERGFKTYAHDHGDWPSGTPSPGAIPPGMESALSGTDWTRRTPIGGRYVWLTDTLQHGERIRAGVAIVSVPGNPVSDDLRQLQALDRNLDDGNFRFGQLRLGFRNEPVYVLEH